MTWWAKAVAAGVPDDLFWESTPREVVMLMQEINAIREAEGRAAALNAGLVAAEVYNSNPFRKKGTKGRRPTDYLRKPTRVLTPAQMHQMMTRWIGAHNAGRVQ